MMPHGPVQNGIGFESDPAGPTNAIVIADSVAEFSGNQGSNNWLRLLGQGNDSDGFMRRRNSFLSRGTDNVLSATIIEMGPTGTARRATRHGPN